MNSICCDELRDSKPLSSWFRCVSFRLLKVAHVSWMKECVELLVTGGRDVEARVRLRVQFASALEAIDI